MKIFGYPARRDPSRRSCGSMTLRIPQGERLFNNLYFNLLSQHACFNETENPINAAHPAPALRSLEPAIPFDWLPVYAKGFAGLTQDKLRFSEV